MQNLVTVIDLAARSLQTNTRPYVHRRRLCQMFAVGISFAAFTLFASAKARDGADEELFRENAQKFHLNFM
jgi:hypothetical protein